MTLHSASSSSFLSETEENHYNINENKIIDMLLAIFEAIVVIILESILFDRFQKRIPPDVNIEEGLTKGIPVYLVIFIISLVFQVALAWDAVYNKNTIQVIAFNLFNLCCFIYAVFQFKQIARALKDTLGDRALVWDLQKFIIANPIIIGICQLVYFYLGARLYLEFGWRVYKKIGADPDIRNMYRWYQIFLTILKLDIFFFLGYSVQYLVLVLQKGDAEYPLTIVALPLICIGLLLAVYAIKHESKQMIMLFFLGLAAGVAYFIFKICRMYDESQAAKYLYVKQVLTFFVLKTAKETIDEEENENSRTLSLD
ncbi:hypothetical protein BDF20DRAFT_906240 [Mycotypha africana]|uniref:uncharacterized protein n=1 Tax=Mycotypha africana TaxID=64632 RepID=UPI00230044BC|nr:uncharacterized protein BDF20DRAFT_906240 [Mycotypha africana]KAI8979801.1 hypothetical protein BDF20DRAFT_906240 [Mycotypha africana]